MVPRVVAPDPWLIWLAALPPLEALVSLKAFVTLEALESLAVEQRRRQ